MSFTLAPAPGPRPDPAELRRVRFDLVVVGGGIQGCGIARDAALRGLKVVLFERDDLAAGTSSRSSKLAHGGLRYLEQFRLGLVRESLRERHVLLQTAPHLVRKLPFLLPIYAGQRVGRGRLGVGLTLYDLLAGRGGLGRHRMLSPAETLAREPRLRPEGLRGAALFYDAQMNDARLVIENAIDARAAGAQVWTRVEVEAVLAGRTRAEGVRAHDRVTGERFDVQANLVVNAAGPWYTQLLERQRLSTPTRLRLSRGTHLVVPSLTRGHALLLLARSDGRVFFVLPWKGRSLVGTTEVELTDPSQGQQATEAEIEYLLQESAHVLGDGGLRRDDVLCAFAGVRALIDGPEPNVGAVSREALIREEAPGLLGVLGGKYTTYRAVAERAVDRAVDLLGHSTRKVCTTHLRALPGGRIADMNDYFAVAESMLVKKYKLPIETLRHLVGTYGSRHIDVLQVLQEDPALGIPIEDGYPFTPGELVHAVRHELALELEDLLWRRTWRGFAGVMDDAVRARWDSAVAARSPR